MIKPMTLAALVLVTACAAQPPAEVHTVSPPVLALALVDETQQAAPRAAAAPAVSCDIRATRTANGQRLEAVAYADKDLLGGYDFVVTAQGSGGSSDISQGGEFDLAAGERATVGSVEIPRGRYRAILTLSDARGDICTLERRS